MFIESRRGYTRSGEQRASGSFLMVFARGRELRALVRYVRMHQCGNFMMASIDVQSVSAREANQAGPYGDVRRVFDGRYHVVLSGAYGDDGLPMSEESYPGLWDHLHPVPGELVKAFWDGGGHNTSGSETMAMHAWAKANAKKLRQLLPVRNSDAAASSIESEKST
jgi:hypothetical protein